MVNATLSCSTLVQEDHEFDSKWGQTKDYTIAIFRIPTNHVVLSYNNKQ